MTDVFISYSRRNLDFVLKLADALEAHGKVVWFDQTKEPLQGLPPFSEWWEEIKYGIEAADNFMFVISSESVVSPYCNAEIAHALAHDRRVVTVLYRGENKEQDILEEIDAAIDAIPESEELPPTVSADISKLRSLTRRNWLKISGVNYLAFSGDRDFEVLLGLLIEGLDLDIAWRRLWSQVRQAAQIWAETGDDGDLWSETRLKPIREMVNERGQELTDLERDFLKPETDRLLEEIDNPETVHTRRSAIGERLSALGDPRPGVGLVQLFLSPLTDERDIRLWGADAQSEGLPDIVWCRIPGGEVAIEDDVKITIPVEPFLLAKYPITYIQYRAFLEAADGSYNWSWWKGLPAEDYQRLNPGEQNFKFDNHPAENVSWYDAMAFCRWLSVHTGHQLRLPTEWEWQQAATGGYRANVYPWGAEWDGTKANTIECGLGRTTAVGMYPAGASRFGPLDMSGNVREWCANESVLTTEWPGRARCMVRGGSWNGIRRRASTGWRRDLSGTSGNRYPQHRGSEVGFRVAVSPPSR